MKFYCKEFDCETDDVKDCPECPDYNRCKKAGLLYRQKDRSPSVVQKQDPAGKVPNPIRVSEIQKVLIEGWPSKCAMPPCPIDDQDCENCDKKSEGLKVSFLPCSRDIAFFAVLYEFERNAAKRIHKGRVTIDGKRRVAELRMKKKAVPVVTMEKGFFPDGIPKVLNTWIRNTVNTERLDAILDRFIGGYSEETRNPPSRVGTRQFVSFIRNVDDLLSTEEKIPKDEIILAALQALDPPLYVSLEAIRKARFHYRHSE